MSEYNVVVAVANPDNVPPLMHIGCVMANEYGGRIVAVTVVEMDCEPPGAEPQCPDRMTAAYRMLDAAEEIAGRHGVQYDGRLAVGRRVHDVLDEVANSLDASLIIVGFSEREHPGGEDSDFDRLVDEIAAHAPCNLLVARFRDHGRYDRVLVPVRARLNLDVRRDFVTALHRRFGAEVDVVHFACNEDEAAAKQDELHRWLVERGLYDWARLRVEVHHDPARAIVDASADYDAVVLGTEPLHDLRRKFFGEVPEQVASEARCTTFLVRTQGIRAGG